MGLPGVGKSTVASLLAARWGCASVDTDDLVAAGAGEPVGAFLDRVGEARFREAEAAALVGALALDAVVSTGGGIVARDDVRATLRAELTLWLDADDHAILARLDGVPRPLLGDDAAAAIERLRRERGVLYDEVSSVRVDATGAPEVVADLIDAALAGGGA